MQFYFDESGDFSPPQGNTEHKASVVVGVDIPETIESRVFESYDIFVAGLTPKEFDRNGQIKGTNQASSPESVGSFAAQRAI